MILREPAATHPDAHWDQVLTVNLDAPFILAREFGRDMVARGSGKDHLHCLAAHLSRRHQRAQLCSEQRRHWTAHKGAEQRMGGQGRERQRHRARLH
jgi:NAD(P)-dependent dehydrogenase (short-subunit alcohol dehydrogenase family)